jgi:hypothetical protein
MKRPTWQRVLAMPFVIAGLVIITAAVLVTLPVYLLARAWEATGD